MRNRIPLLMVVILFVLLVLTACSPSFGSANMPDDEATQMPTQAPAMSTPTMGAMPMTAEPTTSMPATGAVMPQMVSQTNLPGVEISVLAWSPHGAALAVGDPMGVTLLNA